MMQGKAGGRPEPVRLIHDALERANGERLVRLIFQEAHPAALVVITYQAGERDDRPVTRSAGADDGDERFEIERRGGHRHGGRHGHVFSIAGGYGGPPYS